MTFFLVDDKLHDHRKARAAGVAAMGLWLAAGSWSCDNLTDGFIPESVAARWDKAWRRLAARLVDAGLWEPASKDGEPGWVFHDWDERGQATVARVEERRAAKAAAGREGGRRSAAVRQQPSRPLPGGQALAEALAQPPDEAPATADGAAESKLARARPLPLPLPLTPTAPNGAADDVPPIGVRAQALATVYVELVPLSRFPAVLSIAKKALDAGYPDEAVEAALRRLAAEGRPVTVDVLRVELDGFGLPRPGQSHNAGILDRAMARAQARDQEEARA